MPLHEGANVIRITILGKDGSVERIPETELSIRRVPATADGMPITHTIAVKVVTGGAGSERNVLEVLVKKGTLLPASGKQAFRAARNLRAGDGTFLDFEVFEQADGVDDPQLNLPIGAFRIEARDLEPGDVIKKGEPVWVDWAIDANGLLRCALEIPEISKRYETGRNYVSTRDHKNFDGEDGQLIASEALSAAANDLDRTDKSLGVKVGAEISALRGRVERQMENLRLMSDADTRRGATEEARLIRQEAARIRNRRENIKMTVRSDIDEFVEMFSTSVATVLDPKVAPQVHRLASTARDALVNDDQHSIDDARQSLDQMRAVVFGELARHPEFWIGMFEDLAADRHVAIDKNRHDELVQEGIACIKEGDVQGIQRISSLLRENMATLADSSRPDILSGLMR